MRLLILLLLTIFSFGSAQIWHPGLRPRFDFGLLGFLFLVLAFFLFAIIFWSVYLWLVKGKEKKE